ncbi:polysaccharide biosynthesis protein [Haloterrigena salina JCM 13891]|uniref:Polysaccharide biosynthesis protein n=1 Tax=Haloterrigena salina JCM 13891 TaxID=1227488 RepID=M0C7A0_9EURY|nr:oligosaccharide flippase family protein [Haloterrigena salina]ELZ19141.1 polysaccharide biosynthesis protein [Haloterrigena salina JCM 13891]
MSDDDTISLGLESLKGFLGKSTQFILGFIGTVLFARILGPTSFGGFYFLLSLVNVFDNPLRGLSVALEKRVSEAESASGEILGGVLLVQLVVFTCAAVLVFAFGDLLTAETNVANAPLVFFALFVSINLFLVTQHHLSGHGHPALQIWTDTLRSVLTIVLQLAFVLYGLGAAGMGYGLAAATILTVPVVQYVLPLRPKFPTKETARSVWRYARYSIPNAMMGTAFSRLDILLIAFFITTGAAGQYETAYKLTMPATLLSMAIAPALLPKVSKIHSKGEDVSADISNAIAFSSALAIPIFFGALSISEGIVVTVYGGEYRAAATLLVGLAFYQILNTQTTMYGRAVNAIDLPDVNLRISMATLAVNVILGIALVFTYGSLGVVIATIVAEFLRYVLYIAVVKQYELGVNVFPRTLFEQFLAGLVMFAVVELANARLPIRSSTDLLVIIGTGAIVYGLTLVTISSNLRAVLRSVYSDVLS